MEKNKKNPLTNPLYNSNKIKTVFKGKKSKIEIGYAKTGNISRFYFCQNCNLKFTGFINKFNSDIYKKHP